jgi:hypothetical protein
MGKEKGGRKGKGKEGRKGKKSGQEREGEGKNWGERIGNEGKRKRGVFLATEGQIRNIRTCTENPGNNFEKVRKKHPDFRLKPGIREALP